MIKAELAGKTRVFYIVWFWLISLTRRVELETQVPLKCHMIPYMYIIFIWGGGGGGGHITFDRHLWLEMYSAMIYKQVYKQSDCCSRILEFESQPIFIHFVETDLEMLSAAISSFRRRKYVHWVTPRFV